jgi:ADP-ribose pyrophosphatase
MKIIHTKTLYKSNWSSFKEKKFINKDNIEKTWEYIERNNNIHAAVIIPIDFNKNKIVLIKQFRVPLGKYIIEFPAGLIDPGEKPEETAVRELLEETGYRTNEILSVSPALCTSPGLTNEMLYIIEAEINSEKQEEQKTEDSEDIEVIVMDICNFEEELLKLDRNQYIIDVKVWTYLKELKFK